VDDAIGEIQLVKGPQSYDLTAMGPVRAAPRGPFSGMEAERQFRSKVRVHCGGRVAATAIFTEPRSLLSWTVHRLDPARRKLQSGQNLGRRPGSQMYLAGITHFRPSGTAADQVSARDSWQEMGTH
jgi:hypothetical protein